MNSKSPYSIGDKVCWESGDTRLEGIITDIYTHYKDLDSMSVQERQDASPYDFALLLEMSDGRKVLKLASQVQITKPSFTKRDAYFSSNAARDAANQG